MKDFSLKYNLLYFTTWFIFTTVFLLTQPEENLGQELTAKFAKYAKLHAPNGCPTPYYDGEDRIYLFGGCYYEDKTDIQFEVYSIATGTLTLHSVGKFPGRIGGGTIQADKVGNIFYFGGGDGNQDVYKLDCVTNETSKVATLPVSVKSSTSIKHSDSSNTVYIFGGSDQGTTLLAFDLRLYYECDANKCEDKYKYNTTALNQNYSVNAAASVQAGDKLYIFDRRVKNKIVEFDFNTLQMSLVGRDTIPRHTGLVQDRTYSYFIKQSSDENSKKGIYEFSLKTFENIFLPVSNFPMLEGIDYYSTAPASVYVEKQNRIYFFGGESGNNWGTERSRNHDEIFYIDLSPQNPELNTTTTTGQPGTTTINPEVFNCINRTTDFYPHPSDSECASFIGCHNGEVALYHCPSPLLFDPVKRRCDFPEEVKCDGAEARH